MRIYVSISFIWVTERRIQSVRADCVKLKDPHTKKHLQKVSLTVATSANVNNYDISSQLNVSINVRLISISCCQNTDDVELFTLCKDANLANPRSVSDNNTKGVILFHIFKLSCPWGCNPAKPKKKKNRLKYIKKGIKESADTLKSFKGVWLYQRMSTLKYETTHMTREERSVYNS